MNKYEQLQQIGRGSFGVVYKCRMKNTGQFVALKIISMYGKTQQDLEQLQKEIDLLKTIQHPNIIKFFESFEEDNNICIVTELAQTDLFEICQEKSLPIEQIQLISYQIVSVINQLHQLRVVHRDIKPQNVLITIDGKCKLCDFGFARQMSMQTMNLHSIKGSPIYLAPEIAKNQAYNSKSDIWSLGIMLFELAAGKAPFLAKDFIQLLGILQSDNLKAPFEKYSIFKEYPVFYNFIEHMLRKNPEKRYTAEKLLQHPFLNDNSPNLLLVKNMNEVQLQRDWYSERELQVASVNLDILIYDQAEENQVNLFANVIYKSWKENIKELNNEIYVEFPLFQMFVDSMNNPYDIDSIFSQHILKDIADTDQYLKIDYGQLNATKGQPYWQTKIDFLMHCLVMSPGFFLKIVICLAQYRHQQLASDQIYQVISLVRCLCFIFGAQCSFEVPLLNAKEVCFPNEMLFSSYQVQLPFSQLEKIKFTPSAHNQSNLINQLSKEKHLVDAFEILISILQQLLPEGSHQEENKILRGHLINILITACDSLFSFSQLILISYVPFLKHPNKVVQIQKSNSEKEKEINYDTSILEIQSLMLQQQGKPKLPEYFNFYDKSQQADYYFQNLILKPEKQDFILVVIYKLIVHYHDHLAKTSSLLFDYFKNVYNMQGKSTLISGVDQLYNTYLENCILKFYSQDQQVVDEKNLDLITPELYRSVFIGLSQNNNFTDFDNLTIQKNFAQMFQSMILDYQIILPLLIQRKMDIPQLFYLKRDFTMLDVQEFDFIQDIQQLLQKYKKPYQLQKAIFEDNNLPLKKMFENQKYFLKFVFSILPFLFLKQVPALQYFQTESDIEKAMKNTQNHFFKDFEQLSIQLLSSIFYSDTIHLLPHCYHLQMDPFPTYWLNMYTNDQQTQKQFVINDDGITLNYLKDYCNNLQEKEIPFRGHQILTHPQLVSAFENLKNLHLPLSSSYQQNGLHGNNIYSLSKILLSTHFSQQKDLQYIISQTLVGGVIYQDLSGYKIFSKVLTVSVNMHSVVDFKLLQIDFLYQGAPHQCIKQGQENIDEYQLSLYEGNTEVRVKYLQVVSFMINNNVEMCKLMILSQYSQGGLTISYLTLLISSIYWIPASAREEELRLLIVTDIIKCCPAQAFKVIEQDSESIMTFMGQESLQNSVIINHLLGRVIVYVKAIAIQFENSNEKFDVQMNYILNFAKDLESGQIISAKDELFKYPYFQLSTGTRIVLPILNEIYENNFPFGVVLRAVKFLNTLLDLKFPLDSKYDEIVTLVLLSLEKLIDTFIVEQPLMSSISTQPTNAGYLDCIFQFLMLIPCTVQNYFNLLNKVLVISNLQFNNSIKQAVQSSFAPPLHLTIKSGQSRQHQLVCAAASCPTCLYNLNNSTYQDSPFAAIIDRLHKIQSNRNYQFVFYHWDHLFSPQSVLFLAKIVENIVNHYTQNQIKYKYEYTSDLSSSFALIEALRILCLSISKQAIAAQIIMPALYLGGQTNTENLFMLIIKTIISTEKIFDDQNLLPLILLEYSLPESLLHANQYFKSQKSLQYSLTLTSIFTRSPLAAISTTFANQFTFSGALLSDYKNFMLQIQDSKLKNLAITEYLSLIAQIARIDLFYSNYLKSVLDFNQLKDLFEHKNLHFVLFNLLGNFCKFVLPEVEIQQLGVENAIKILNQEQPDKQVILQVFFFINYLNLHENQFSQKFIVILDKMKNFALSSFNDLDLRYSALLAISSLSRFLFSDLKKIGLENVVVELFKTIDKPNSSNFAFFDGLAVLIKNAVLEDNLVDDLVRRMQGYQNVPVVKQIGDSRK
ncbi:Kinase, ULK [Spironucleus salmonicida]|uniref:non-specific serine/threonine protein kinase n=1 Tax=Spironucleus salmonicida TaxID=348837 RepID=V6LRI8_9EUKA|nr:Kinase, ULK [Spironucleus salmonicida]|eukprot:EST46311.1 Kinase, ULK [Spironucleus salmonicida]